MAQKSGIAACTLMAGLLLTTALAEAQQEFGAGISDAAVITRTAAGGIRADRLSPGQLRIWRRIRRVIFARDANGQWLHPTLERLWRQVESCRHVIYIEIHAHAAESLAGKFTVERIDPEGKKHVLSIHLYLSGINRASTREGARRSDGFKPFEKLNREERYAEVLGHELAHAVLTIQNPGYAALVQEQSRLEAELVGRSAIAGKVVADVTNNLRMRRLDQLAGQVEGPANATEIEIWSELAGKHRRNAGLRR